MKSALPLENDDAIYGDYPALYALGIVTPVKVASPRRAQGRGFALVAILGVAAVAAVAVVWWSLL